MIRSSSSRRADPRWIFPQRYSSADIPRPIFLERCGFFSPRMPHLALNPGRILTPPSAAPFPGFPGNRRKNQEKSSVCISPATRDKLIAAESGKAAYRKLKGSGGGHWRRQTKPAGKNEIGGE
jgi:hypothetical protein